MENEALEKNEGKKGVDSVDSPPGSLRYNRKTKRKSSLDIWNGFPFEERLRVGSTAGCVFVRKARFSLLCVILTEK